MIGGMCSVLDCASQKQEFRRAMWSGLLYVRQRTYEAGLGGRGGRELQTTLGR